ncbi:MAG: hypothetical protein DRP74_03760 [Candidatus Omnitrophota bacterium]|nr:MAG: hypothetical protein DRP74_03760 [Candidatus Omnitrophota bacterium]
MIRKYFKKLPSDLKKMVSFAGRVALLNKTRAYLVGGCVRDLILGAKNFDLDIVVENNGIKFAQRLADFMEAKLTLHKKFATATLKFNDHKVDIATARSENYPAPASLPEIEPGSLKDDLARRDFTINAMAINITGKDFAGFVDFFAGRKDLLHKKIRVMHNLSFIDDPTRILRAIRFEQRLGFEIETNTLKCLKEAARKRMLEKVSKHRLRDELILMLKEDDPVKCLRRIQELADFRFINKRIYLSGKNYRFLKSIKKEVNWFRKLFLYKRKIDSWLVYFTALVEVLSEKEVGDLCDDLALPKSDKKRILSYKSIDPVFISRLKKKRNTPSTIFRLLEPLSYEVILLLRAKFCDKIINKSTENFLTIYDDIRVITNGEDLRRLGLGPGPVYQKIFSRVLNAKVDGLIKSRAEELRLIKKIVNEFK